MFFVAVTIPSDVFSSDDPIEQSFIKLDSDRDGLINIIEAQNQLELLRQWANIDEDTDGQLELSEFSVFESLQALTFEPEINPDDVDPGAELAK